MSTVESWCLSYTELIKSEVCSFLLALPIQTIAVCAESFLIGINFTYAGSFVHSLWLSRLMKNG